MKIIKGLAFFIFVLALFQSPAIADGAQKTLTPEQMVGEFYSWYITKQNTVNFPASGPGIYNYVSKNRVEILRSAYLKNEIDEDYFTKVQDYDPSDWIKNICVGKSIKSNGKVRILVTFGSTDKISVFVFLEQESGIWKIVKVKSAKR